MRRKICVFTGTRAEYGLLNPLIKALKKEKSIELQILVSGMHLSPEFGLTYKEIENDGITINEKIEILLSSDTAVGLSKGIGLGLISFSEAYQRLKPNIIVIVGDRFEAFAAASAAMVSQIPIAHLHGGESTFGVIDEAFRHSITKMSHLHFTATEKYRNRIIQLGESPERVFNVGALGIDNIKNLKLLSKKELEKKINFLFNKRTLLITFHPVTLEKNSSKKQFQNLLEVLNKMDNTNFIFTKANADTDGRIINYMIDEYVSKNADKSIAYNSMGYLNYLSALQFVDAVVGNSSSGIIESPSFKIGTINIGDRQKGRIKAESIIDCEPTKQSIKNAINKLYSSSFQKNLKNVVNPYGEGKTALKIVKILKFFKLKNILEKNFYDINFNY